MTRPAPASRFDRRLYAPMILGSILNPVNSSMMAVALLPIGIAFGAPASQTAWLVSALYLATAIGQPVTGRLVDLFGARAVFLVGTVFTLAAGIIGVTAPTLGVLVLARVLLGLGTCAGYPSAMELIRLEGVRTGVEKPSAPLAVLTVANQTIAVLGPILGGVLLAAGDWRGIFAVNVPLALASAVLGWLYLPRRDRTRASGGLDLDSGGMVLFAVTLVALLLFLMKPRAEDWWLLVAAVVAAAGFVLWELRARRPFIDLRVLVGNRPLQLTYARMMLAAMTGYMFMYGVTQWLQAGYGLTPTQSGLLLLPTFVVSIGVTTLTARYPGVRGKLAVSALAQIGVAALLLVTEAASPLWLLVAIAVLLGLPQGMANLASQNALYHQAEPQRLASSAGLLRTFMYLGAITASVANGLAFGAGVDTAGLHTLATTMLGASVLFAVLVVVDRSLVGLDPAGPSPLLVSVAPLLGRLLRGRRAGERNSVRTAPELAGPQTITLVSETFADGAEIPQRCCAVGLGQNVAPALSWFGLPAGTRTLLLVMEDPDVPFARPSIHLVALIDAGLTGFGEGALNGAPAGVSFLTERRGRSGYHGPMPLPDHGPHHYGFHLYALDQVFVPDAAAPSLDALLPRLAGHTLASGSYEGWRESRGRLHIQRDSAADSVPAGS